MLEGVNKKSDISYFHGSFSCVSPSPVPSEAKPKSRGVEVRVASNKISSPVIPRVVLQARVLLHYGNTKEWSDPVEVALFWWREKTSQ
jgi:hypothetical protein